MTKEQHEQRINNQERKDRHNRAKALHQELAEAYGTVEIEMKKRPNSSNTEDVTLPECPECGEGIRITEEPYSYPSVQAECMDCEETFNNGPKKLRETSQEASLIV